MDATIKKLLNDFSKSQPALNLPGVPAAVSGIQLGDLIDAGSNPVAATVAAFSPATSASLTGADTVSKTATEGEIASLKAKVNAIIAALQAAGLMA
jgi:hypothetical protein